MQTPILQESNYKEEMQTIVEPYLDVYKRQLLNRNISTSTRNRFQKRISSRRKYMSEMLEKARNYETEKQVYVKKTTKPLFLSLIHI